MHFDTKPVTLTGSKAQELLCYLILFRATAHPREVLAEILWENSSSDRARRYLRKTLWQLQDTIEGSEQRAANRIFHVDAKWIQLDTTRCIRLDIAAFEDAYLSLCHTGSSVLAERQVQLLKAAIDLYTGDLLEGWYQEWCQHERQRFRYMYLDMLDKFIGYCLANHEYETGMHYCARVMHYDSARERTHRQLMKLYYLAGDRSAAMEQYARCVDILRDELGVSPEVRTQELYRRICSGSPLNLSFHSSTGANSATTELAAISARLEQARNSLAAVQHQLETEMQILDRILNGQR